MFAIPKGKKLGVKTVVVISASGNVATWYGQPEK